MLPQQRLRGPLHGRGVKGHRHVQVRVAFQGAAVTAVDDAVSVGLAPGHEPGVEVRRYLPACVDADVPGQHGVQHKGILVGRNGGMGVEMAGLPQGVNPRVRAAGAGNGDLLPAGAGEGLLQHLLHRQAVVLPLPAAVGRAVVLHRQQHPPERSVLTHSSRPSSTISRISTPTAARAR